MGLRTNCGKAYLNTDSFDCNLIPVESEIWNSVDFDNFKKFRFQRWKFTFSKHKGVDVPINLIFLLIKSSINKYYVNNLLCESEESLITNRFVESKTKEYLHDESFYSKNKLNEILKFENLELYLCWISSEEKFFLIILKCPSILAINKDTKYENEFKCGALFNGMQELIKRHNVVKAVNCLKFSAVQLEIQALCQHFNKLQMEIANSPSFSPKTESFYVTRNVPECQGENIIAAPQNLLFAVLGWSGTKPNLSIEVYDTVSQKWSYMRQKNFIKRAYHGVVAIGILIYVIGGFDGRNCFKSTHCFDIEKRSWSRKRNMYETRCYVTALGHQGMIYAIGGFNGDTRLRSCERFNPQTKRWQLLMNMNARRSDASGVVHREKIYVCGGFDGLDILNTAEMYDLKYDHWTFIPLLLGPRSGHCMVSYQGLLMILGGFDGIQRLKTVEYFDEDENHWNPHVSMISSRSNFAAVVMGDQLYIIGGYNGETTCSDVEKFDDKCQKWMKAESLNCHRSALGACVISNSGDPLPSCHHTDGVQTRRENIEQPSP